MSYYSVILWASKLCEISILSYIYESKRKQNLRTNLDEVIWSKKERLLWWSRWTHVDIWYYVNKVFGSWLCSHVQRHCHFLSMIPAVIDPWQVEGFCFYFFNNLGLGKVLFKCKNYKYLVQLIITKDISMQLSPELRKKTL